MFALKQFFLLSIYSTYVGSWIVYEFEDVCVGREFCFSAHARRHTTIKCNPSMSVLYSKLIVEANMFLKTELYSIKQFS